VNLEEQVMPKFIIEREIPHAGELSPEELRSLSQTSCAVLQKMGPQIQWIQSYVSADKIHCLDIVPDKDVVHEHAQQGGFPANSIVEIKLSSTQQQQNNSKHSAA
jgi:hypothetical protein